MSAHGVVHLVEPRYVVRDLGAALGETGRFAPFRNDPALFEQQRFILDVRHGFSAEGLQVAAAATR